MSRLPLLLSELLEEAQRPVGNLYDQDFGLGLLEHELARPSRILAMPLRSGYVRTWRNFAAGNSGLSTVQSNQNEFKVNLDVQQFKPEELKVKVEGDFIVVDPKHEERSDQHGFISRQFTRKYKIPQDADINALVSNLFSDGVLSLKAPKKISKENPAREIPITRTNTPAVKASKEGEAKKEETGDK